MKSSVLLTVAIAAAFVLMGCSTVGKAIAPVKNVLTSYDNGSLNYTRAQKLPPIVLPKTMKTAPFTPIYQVPADGQALPAVGKQYQLPMPPKVAGQ